MLYQEQLTASWVSSSLPQAMLSCASLHMSRFENSEQKETCKVLVPGVVSPQIIYLVLNIHVYNSVCTYIYVCLCVFVYVCIYIYIHMHATYMFSPKFLDLF